ncbi:aminoglycoside phosphotransferase [Streptomyces sp. WAC 06783]|uniref:phosphotransferase family protein n=1 Tax=Streptomyces sp. WAC 06783 TaxID=2203211 RepID=UPI000F740EDF|nr:aminoglycoside phosphotransferase family protein [Streptomyces sp. WAC 06783]RSO10154.1 aminoglycoside phosphotransferase [Streptomyces sp. WAC 06783]
MSSEPHHAGRSPDLPFTDVLRDRLGAAHNAVRLSSSPRSRVWRVELRGAPAVVKQAVDGADADERYAREVAALRLASRVTPPVVPRLLGTDPAARVLVLEQVDHRRPAPEWVVGYAAALARLHAATASVPADGTPPPLPAWSGPAPADIDSFLTLADRLAAPVPDGTDAELAALLHRLGSAPGRALLHGDPCPGNDLHAPDGIRFIDFEQSCLGNGLTELAYLRVGFPTCWCVTATPEPLLREAEAAYGREWEAATGSAPPGDLVDACAGWLIRGDALVQRAHRGGTDHLARLPDEDWEWGTVTARQRLAYRLGVVARLTADRDDLGGLSRLAEAMRARMLGHWPGLTPPPRERPPDD